MVLASDEVPMSVGVGDRDGLPNPANGESQNGDGDNVGETAIVEVLSLESID